MKTRTFRVALVAVSAAMLTAMGLVGSAYTANAMTVRADRVIATQDHDKGDHNHDGHPDNGQGNDRGHEDDSHQGNEPKTCLIEKAMCDPANPLPVWAPWTALSAAAPINGGGADGGTDPSSIPFGGIGGAVIGGAANGGAGISGGAAIGALSLADNTRDAAATIPFTVPATVGVGRTMLLPESGTKVTTPGTCAVRGDELVFKAKGACAFTTPTAYNGTTMYTTMVVTKGGAAAGTILPAITATAGFAQASSAMTASSAKALAAKIPALKGAEVITVTAYAGQGNGRSAAANAAIANSRAKAVVKYLAGKGLVVDRVVIDTKDKAPHRNAIANGEVVVRSQVH